MPVPPHVVKEELDKVIEQKIEENVEECAPDLDYLNRPNVKSIFLGDLHDTIPSFDHRGRTHQKLINMIYNQFEEACGVRKNLRERTPKAWKQSNGNLYRYMVESAGDIVFTKNFEGEALTFQNILYILFYNATAGLKIIAENFYQSDDKLTSCFSPNCTPLTEATQLGYYNFVKLFVSKGAKLKKVPFSGFESGYHAVKNGNLKLIKFLRTQFPQFGDEYLNNPDSLFLAAQEGHHILVKYLINEMNAISYVNYMAHLTQETPLTIASYKGNEETVQFLLQIGANLEHITNYGHTPLMEAILGGHKKVMQVLTRYGAKCTNSEGCKRTPIWMAVYNGNRELFDVIPRMSTIENESEVKSKSLIMVAAKRGDLAMMKRLIKAGANIHAMRESTGKTALYYAANEGETLAVEFLLEKKVHIIMGKYSPLVAACLGGYFDIVWKILEYLNKKKKRPDKETLNLALWNTVYAGDVKILSLLLKYEKSLCEKGETPLMRASYFNHLPMVEFLISRGAIINEVDTNNQSALAYACAGNSLSIVEYLICNGAKLTDSLPLNLAIKNGHTKVLEFLIKTHYYEQTIENETTKNKAMMQAAIYQHLGMVKCLIFHGACRDYKDENKHNIMDQAFENRDYVLFEFLMNTL